MREPGHAYDCVVTHICEALVEIVRRTGRLTNGNSGTKATSCEQVTASTCANVDS